MLPIESPVAQCGKCSAVYLKQNAEEIGRFDLFGSNDPFGGISEDSAPREWKKAPRVRNPSEEDFYLALDDGLAENEAEEKSIRIWAWWQSNDQFRTKPSFFNLRQEKLSPFGRDANMRRLLQLLDDKNPNDRIMTSEILRQLGRFDEAIEQLSKLDRDVFGAVISQLEEWCDAYDPKVQKLTFSR